MSEKPENPHAFPQSATLWGGMGLLDYFAAAALTGFMARDFKGNDCGNSHHNHMHVRPENPRNRDTAEICYGLARAMLKARGESHD
jgi:hypothetical protein